MRRTVWAGVLLFGLAACGAGAGTGTAVPRPGLAADSMVSRQPKAVQGTVVAYYQPVPYPSGITTGIHVLDGWLPSVYYGKTFQMDDRLQIGGWGDNYRTYIQFDLNGLPYSVTDATLQLYAYPRGDSSTQVNFDAWSPNSAWASSNLTTTMTWDTQPNGYTLVGSYSAGPVNSFWPIGITSLYNNWRSGATANNGLALMSWTQNNNFDVWRSSRYATDTYRPILRLTFTSSAPVFKMPLPRNVSWLVTTEVGGYDCEGAYDPFHNGLNYFSVDFSWKNKNASGAQVYGDPSGGALIPITPAANGTVAEVNQTDPTVPNGYYVVVSHDASGNVNIGYSTRYLHMKLPPLVTVGQVVTQGSTVLGYMGNTGQSHGSHLHFGMRYNNDGSATNAPLSYAVMSGWLMKSFQSECANGTWNRYYMST
jgi:murein DD-endopeptidase MepM/ murein hydrolase activator NlpD